MGSKTKIMVFRMRELIYTGIFAVLGLILIILMILMFRPKSDSGDSQISDDTTGTMKYTAGVYTTPVTLGENAIDVEVTVDADKIQSIRLVNLSESVTTMYPLVEPALDELAEQVCEKQSTEHISYSEDSKYTSQLLLKAIDEALAMAEGDITSD